MAEAVLERARLEEAKTKPDYPEIIKLAQTANSAADLILEKSRSEHEKMERLRKKRTNLEISVKTAYSKAKEYIEDHSSDIGVSAKNSLNNAKQNLDSLITGTNLEKEVGFLETAEKQANEAYTKAENDFNDAESKRMRRRRAAAASYSSPSGSSIFGRSSGSGSVFSRSGSSSGRGRGFGGSRSFGSSGRGFGGSRKW